MDTIFMLNLAGIVAFGVAVLGFFYMMGKKSVKKTGTARTRPCGKPCSSCWSSSLPWPCPGAGPGRLFVITPREWAAVTISGGRWRRKTAMITS